MSTNKEKLLTVMRGRFSEKSKCYVKSCRRKTLFMIFGWDGKPKLSRFTAESCRKHLGEIASRLLRLKDLPEKEIVNSIRQEVSREALSKLSTLGIHDM